MSEFYDQAAQDIEEPTELVAPTFREKLVAAFASCPDNESCADMAIAQADALLASYATGVHEMALATFTLTNSGLTTRVGDSDIRDPFWAYVGEAARRISEGLATIRLERDTRIAELGVVPFEVPVEGALTEPDASGERDE